MVGIMSVITNLLNWVLPHAFNLYERAIAVERNKTGMQIYLIVSRALQ